jgi:hypothetical protein
VDSDLAGSGRSGREIREDNGDVANLRDNWVGLVGCTLLISGGMDMDVGDDPAVGFAAMLPKAAQTPTINNDDASFQRIRIKIVIKNKFFNPPCPVFATEKKSTAFAPAARTSLQLSDPRFPNRGITKNFRPRPEDAARERCY